MKIKTISFLAITAIMSFSCGEKHEDPKKETIKEEHEETCYFSLNEGSVEVNWTAFKFTEKAGVGGKFDSVVVTGCSNGEFISQAVVNSEFTIYTNSVNSNNPDRDAKLANGFYGSMENPDVISGKVISMEEDGSGKVLINMNGTEKEADFSWNFDNDHLFSLATNINVVDWNAQASLDSLNLLCKDLHTGTDGKSVLWPDVDIEVKAQFTEVCK